MVFTGIVQTVGVATWDVNGVRLRVKAPSFFRDVVLGGSVAVAGVCLTAVELSPDECAFDVMEETRNIVEIPNGPVNLELPMKHGDPLGGHVVLGHVDTKATILSIERRTDGSSDVWLRLPADSRFEGLVVNKGCIALSGTSLTVASLEDKGTKLRVSLIPHTLANTIFGTSSVGDNINVEYDQALKKRVADGWNEHETYMRRAFEVSLKGRYTAPPNPWVGALLVCNGALLGEGHHERCGSPHAEVNAITAAEKSGYNVAGSTLYVTLEPCSHYGRTPPCSELIISKRISTVYVSVLDPDERVRGKGCEALRNAGITVHIGTLSAEVTASLEPYLFQRRHGRPFIVCKVAMSLDGAIACEDGTSQWITGPQARSHVLRAKSQAVLVGSTTALRDNPTLTVRDVADFNGPQPLRVVLDSNGRVNHQTTPHLLDVTIAPTLIFTTERCGEAHIAQWRASDVEVVVCEGDRPSIPFVVKELGRRGVLQLLVEGGGEMHASFLREDLVDQLSIFYGNTILGSSAVRWQRGSVTVAETISKAPRLQLRSCVAMGDDVCIEYRTKTGTL